jgi:hypothetical protein
MYKLTDRLCTCLCAALAATTLLAQPAAADPAMRRLHVFVPIPAVAASPLGGESQQDIIATNVGQHAVTSTHFEYIADMPGSRFANTVFAPGRTSSIERGGNGGSPATIDEFGASPDVVFSSRFVAQQADGTQVPYRLPVFTEDDVYSAGTTATLQLLPTFATGSIEMAIFSLDGTPETCVIGAFDGNGENRATSTLALPPGPRLASHTVAAAAAAISYVNVSCNGRFFVFATRLDSANPEFVWPGRSDAP